MKAPFGWSKSDPADAMVSSSPTASFASSVTNTGKGIAGQFKTMGTVVSSAATKAKNVVTSSFTTPSGEVDETSLSNMPTNLGPEIWVTQGQLYESQGNFAKALDNYTKALEKQPKNEAALLATARLYARQGQLDQSNEFFQKAIALKPQASLYNELAIVQQQQNKAAEAQLTVQKAIELEPSNARYRDTLAGMMVSTGRSDEAVKQLEQVFPPAVANYKVAYLHFTNQNIAAAQQHLQVALQVDPNLKEARDLMARLGNGQTAQSAVAAYQSATQLYQTAQTIASPTTPANPAVYQQSGTNSSMPTATFPGAGMPTVQ
ncbi:tetratricopeptide repeat protein [Aureliella helgolandensis]|nr:tetratricopeptide repeat protein [Aureliella helgolandensis]